MVEKRTADVVTFRAASYLVLTLFVLLCLLPFAIIVVASFTDEMEILVHGYSLWPRQLSLAAYQLIFQVPQKMLRAYGITAFSTVVGTTLGLFLMSMAAYVLNRKDFRYRNGAAFYLYFTTLFSGGLVPYYILMIKGFWAAQQHSGDHTAQPHQRMERASDAQLHAVDPRFTVRVGKD